MNFMVSFIYLFCISQFLCFNVFWHPFPLSLQVVLLNQVTTKHTEGSFQLTLALGNFPSLLTLPCHIFIVFFVLDDIVNESCGFFKFPVLHDVQVIVGHTPAQTGSFCIGMAMNDMHILTSHPLFGQHQRHILWLVKG